MDKKFKSLVEHLADQHTTPAVEMAKVSIAMSTLSLKTGIRCAVIKLR